MAGVRGESYAHGVAVEATRGTFSTAQDYIRSREPGTIQTIVEKVDLKETKSTGMNSQGQVVTMTKVEGELPFNLRYRSIGYLLKSLLGGLSSATEAGETIVYRHSITLDPTVQQPSLSFSLAKGTFDHKEVNGAVVSALSLNVAMDDVINGTATIKGRSETTASDFTPGYATDDYLAPHQTMTLKIADDVAGLAGATAISVSDLSINQDRGSREKYVVSSLAPVDHVAKLLTVTGAFNQEKEDDTFRDLAIANTSKALQISIVNTAQLIGVASYPTITVTLPNVTFQTSETRPLDDVVTEEVSFTAHYDDTEADGILVSLLNTKANYNA